MSMIEFPGQGLAMMGALGMLTQSLVQLPGYENVPKDVSACTVGNGQTGFLLVIAIIAVLEATVFVQDESKEPGNFGNPLPWFDDYSDEMRAREINNGPSLDSSGGFSVWFRVRAGRKHTLWRLRSHCYVCSNWSDCSWTVHRQGRP